MNPFTHFRKNPCTGNRPLARPLLHRTAQHRKASSGNRTQDASVRDDQCKHATDRAAIGTDDDDDDDDNNNNRVKVIPVL
jgi:hypothetical protein